jgi:ElaB/YqjD/DUF883 family membrane-anchored ribosome-binding protein
MFLTKTPDTTSQLVSRASQAADQAIQSTQQAAAQSVEKLAGAMQDLRDDALPVLNHAVDGVSAFAHRSVDSVRDASHQLRAKAERASENTASYIRHDPLKSVLIAAATGATLMALVSLLTRNRDRH